MARRDRLSAGPADLGVLGAGLLLIGLSAFIYLGAADRGLGPVGALPLSVLWTLSNVLGPALFVPVEQEIARAVAHCAAGGEDHWPAVRRAAAVTAGLVGLVALVSVLWRGPLTRTLFPGHPQLLTATVLITAAFAVQHVTRGVFAGTGRFQRYGVQLLIDGVLRGGLVLAISAAGRATVTGFATVLVVAPTISVLATVPVPRRGAAPTDPAQTTTALASMPTPLLPNPTPTWRSVVSAIGLLVATQTASTVVIGGSAVAARMLAHPAELALAADLIAALLLSRVPLLAFYAVQPALIPRIAWIARRGTPAQIRRTVGKLVTVVLAAGIAAVAAAFALGAPIARIVFGGGIRVTGMQAALAFAAVVLFVTATILTQSLVAMRAYRLSTLVWGVACASYLGLLAASPGDLQHRIMLALLASVALALLAGAVALTGATKQRPNAGATTPPAGLAPASQKIL